MVFVMEVSMTNYWIKLYHEILDDPKMATLPDGVWRRCVELFLLAGRLNKDGILPCTKQIAWALRMDVKKLEADIKELERVGVLKRDGEGWEVSHFATRQAASSDKERKTNERNRKNAEQYYKEPVTKRDKLVTPPVTIRETDQITDNRSDNRSEAEAEQITPPPPIEEQMYRAVTHHTGTPSGERDEIYNTMRQIISLHGENTLEYLRPFWETCHARYPGNIKAFWLTDWAATGIIPNGKPKEPIVDMKGYTYA
jgi:hypothetical protein